MDNISKALNLLLAPLGIKSRPFLVDYSDNAGKDYNTVAYPPPSGDDEFIAACLINTFTLQGYTVNMITEILDGYSKEEIEALAESNPKEAAKHIRFLYLNEMRGTK